MCCIRRLLQSVFILLLLAGLQPIAAQGAATGAANRSPLISQAGAAAEAHSRNAAIPEGFARVGENDLFELYANPETLAFKVVDKRNGYIWHSNLDEKLPEDRLNKTWTAFAASGVSIDYYDTRLNEKRASITNAEHTIDYRVIEQGFEAALTFTDAAISLSVRVTLHPDGVEVSVPFSSIKEENPDFRLELLHVYPFFGATRADAVPGYMFIPDGSGSLIRFAAVTRAKNVFYGKYYGDDLGMVGSITYDRTINRPYKISIPVIGMVHEDTQNAYIAIVEKGAAYGQFLAHPSGIITNFNFLYNTFVYNRSYFQATNRSGDGVNILQPKTNEFDVLIHYRFIAGEDATYVGMARSYRDYLIEQGNLQKVVQPGGDIGIRLEFLAGDKERVLFWERMITMTTVEQMEAILADLGIANAEVIYYGWQPLGASSMPPKSFKLDDNLGSRRQLIRLIEEVQSRGGNFYLYLDPQAAFEGESGYSSRSDLAMAIINVNIASFNRNLITYFRNYRSLEDYFESISRDVIGELGAALALDGIGANLYSDYKRGNFLSREAAIDQYRALLGATGSRFGFYLPNHYVFRFMQAYFDIPITDSGYLYTSEAVPFLEIALSGYVPTYGPALNFSSNIQEDLLRHADFGVYPSFFLTHEMTARMLDTKANWIFTSAYAQWGDDVKQTYQWLNQLLAPVKGQEIVARKQLSQGVFATVYGNGKMIVVNYTNRPFSLADLTVNGRDAVLSEVLP